jgi:uncharacterized membrane protein YfcA
MNILLVIQIILVILFIGFTILLILDFRKNKEDVPFSQQIAHTIVGFFAMMCDCLGIGSFALLSTFYRNTNLIDDRVVPGTMVMGNTLPVAIEALCFITSVRLDIRTLVTMIIACAVGSYFGAKLNGMLPGRTVKTFMAIGMFLAAFFMLLSKFNLMPVGGNAVGLYGAKLIFACTINFILGVAASLGVGQYAPTMALVYLLGMNPLVTFPIMMGSGTFLCFSASIPFFKNGQFSRRATMGISIGGIAGVLVAIFIIKSLPLSAVQWLVIVVVFYTSIKMMIELKKGPAEG